MPILAINAGSSTVKIGWYEPGDPAVEKGKFSRAFPRDFTAPSLSLFADAVVAWIRECLKGATPEAIGHRVVHGGPDYRESARVTPEMLQKLGTRADFDPEHLPQTLALIEALGRAFPNVPQVACFDTAFHRDLPRVAQLLPIPRRYEAQGVRRYGFHGISCSYIMEKLSHDAPEEASGRVIIAHLGHGASMTAVHGGKSVETTMSFTPAAGIPMSTRSGDIDPGLVGYLARGAGMSAEQFNHMAHFESGLLGVSETTADMKTLIEKEETDPRAAEAVALFCYEAKKRVGSLAAALGGLDAVVFTGGIGEEAPKIRAWICGNLEFLGIQINEAQNNANADVISAAASRVKVRVMRTDEEIMIAKETQNILHLQNI
jgi:acetate kinase